MAVVARAIARGLAADVPPRWVAWAVWPASVMTKAADRDAFLVASAGNKVVWTTAHTCNRVAWGTTRVTL